MYYFTRDLSGANTCTGGCAPVWPIFYEANLVVGDGLNAADFTTITTSDGKPQTAYEGWPMYYYAPDGAKRNTIEGDGIGNIWAVANP
ncbi:COG4315 family predicted lipoprotein [Hymenobacter sp. PAMC 26628]|uniref:COG4315 family predicted lipoprotein n=1 Tax=Hymenobacter sp. PAMC 26628 TaxID=1484118 RepID=UPI00077009F2|nr:hypothetical protein [Hymenobacter sp. PAMC 26628]AMJ65520.1 hypothetical protein AXW84_08820 [Hymenobacter sp. PAMC 26628]